MTWEGVASHGRVWHHMGGCGITWEGGASQGGPYQHWRGGAITHQHWRGGVITHQINYMGVVESYQHSEVPSSSPMGRPPHLGDVVFASSSPQCPPAKARWTEDNK